MFGIRDKAAHAAKRAGLLTGGLFFCAVGTAFLTVAGWLALVPLVGAQITALIVAGVYLGMGFILIGITLANGNSTISDPAKQTPPVSENPPILQAFMYGLQAGARTDQARHGAKHS